MSARTFLAFDYGERNTGVAVGGTQSRRAQPLTVLTACAGEPDWTGISRLIEEWRPHALIVGLPLNMDGSTNRMTRVARAFGDHLRDRYNLTVHMVDERLSSRAATDALIEAGVPLKRHKHRIDKIAAQTILQTFLDEQTAEESRGTSR